MGLFKKHKTVDLKVTGMHCGHCEMSVSKALKAVPGVKDAKADHKTHTASITADEGISVDALVEAVNEAGYTAEPA